MFEDSVSSIPSIWASMNSWFTPAVLFVLLNVMIGTIAFTSTLANQKYHHNHNPNPNQQQQQQQQQNHRQNDPQQPNLVGSPSVLQRLRSINFYSYRSQEPSHFKPISPDSSISDSHNNIEPPHHQVQLHYQTESSFQTHSQYIFAQTASAGVTAHHEEKQQAGFYQNPHETPQVNNYYRHEQIYQGKSLENQSAQYFFEQTNEVKHQEEEETGMAGFDFRQVRDHENNTTTQENGTHFDFEQAKEEKVEENEYHYDSEKAHEENFENDKLQSLDEVYSKLAERHVSRSNSDTNPSAGEVPTKLPTKMKKSASMKSAFNHFEEEDIVEARRPVTVKGTSTRGLAEADEEVDAKADDFINRFKQQLKLQRLDSIIRYKEMIGRGGGGGGGR